MPKHNITAVFDTRAHAEQAMAQLKSSGIPASDITLLPASGEAVSATETGNGFWISLEQLFGGTEDHATYAESIRRGGIMLSVRTEDDRLDYVVDILEQHGSVDLDEREAAWRKDGWTGSSSTSGARTTSSRSAMAGSRGLASEDPGMTAMGSTSSTATGFASSGSPAGDAASRGDTMGSGSGLGPTAASDGLRGGTSTSFGTTAGDGTSKGTTTGASSGLGTVEAGFLGAAAGALGTAAYGKNREAGTILHETATPTAGTSSTATDRAVGSASTGGIVGKIRDAAEDVIQVVEERLNVGKRSVSRGKVRVHTSVVSRDVSEDVMLHDETVRVDRRPVDRPVSAAGLADPFKERVIELEEFGEEAVVGKTAHVVEEIGLRRDGVDHVETVRDSVRSTKVDIDDGRTVAGVGAAVGIREGSDGGRIVEHMEVYASDGSKVGTVDHMDGPDKIKLAKSTSPDGQHHLVPMTWVDHVDQHVHLNKTVAEMKASRSA